MSLFPDGPNQPRCAQLFLMAWMCRYAQGEISADSRAFISEFAEEHELESLRDTVLAEDWTPSESQVQEATKIVQGMDGVECFFEPLIGPMLSGEMNTRSTVTLLAVFHCFRVSGPDLEMARDEFENFAEFDETLEEWDVDLEHEERDSLNYELLPKLVSQHAEDAEVPSPACLMGLPSIGRRLSEDDEVEWDSASLEYILGPLPDAQCCILAARSVMKSFSLTAALHPEWWNRPDSPLLVMESAANAMMVRALAEVLQAEGQSPDFEGDEWITFDEAQNILDVFLAMDRTPENRPLNTSIDSSLSITTSLMISAEGCEPLTYTARLLSYSARLDELWEAAREDLRTLQRVEGSLRSVLEAPIWPDGLPDWVLNDLPDSPPPEIQALVGRINRLAGPVLWEDRLHAAPEETRDRVLATVR